MKVRKGSARWLGELRNGRGEVELTSGAIKAEYGFDSRFLDGPGTNPEELIAAAHAGCYSMALAGALNDAGYKPEEIETIGGVSLEKTDGGFSITRIHLETKAVVPNIVEEQFRKIAEDARQNCPVSRALASVEITGEVRLA